MKKSFDLDALFDGLKEELLDAAAEKGGALVEELHREGLKKAIQLGDRFFNGAPRSSSPRSSSPRKLPQAKK